MESVLSYLISESDPRLFSNRGQLLESWVNNLLDSKKNPEKYYKERNNMNSFLTNANKGMKRKIKDEWLAALEKAVSKLPGNDLKFAKSQVAAFAAACLANTGKNQIKSLRKKHKLSQDNDSVFDEMIEKQVKAGTVVIVTCHPLENEDNPSTNSVTLIHKRIRNMIYSFINDSEYGNERHYYFLLPIESIAEKLWSSFLLLFKKVVHDLKNEEGESFIWSLKEKLAVKKNDDLSVENLLDAINNKGILKIFVSEQGIFNYPYAVTNPDSPSDSFMYTYLDREGDTIEIKRMNRVDLNNWRLFTWSKMRLGKDITFKKRPSAEDPELVRLLLEKGFSKRDIQRLAQSIETEDQSLISSHEPKTNESNVLIPEKHAHSTRHKPLSRSQRKSV
jgi:hypothetical protein